MKIQLLIAFSAISIYSYGQTAEESDSLDMNLSDVRLNEVFIQSKKPLFIQKSDKLIFNVEQSILSDGTNVLDVLSRAPGVVVGHDGELSVRGKKGVSVMINGKLTHLSQKELANVLKSTSSASLKQIEVITNPSAQYDAAGNAGIINIVLKKSTTEGLSGNIFTNAGRSRKNRMSSGANFSYTKNRLSLFGDYTYTFRGEEEQKIFTQNAFDSNGVLAKRVIQSGKTNEPLTSNNFKLGLDYAFSTSTSLGASLDAKIGRYQNDHGGSNQSFSNQLVLLSHAITSNNDKESWKDYTLNVNGRHVFNDKGTVLTVDASYEASSFKSNQFQTTRYLVEDPLIEPGDLDRRGYIPSKLKVFDGKMDLILPINEQQTLDLGWKSSVKSNDNPTVYESLDQPHWVIDTKATNHFQFDEQIHAAYANYALNWDRLTVQAGVRMEYTSMSGEQQVTLEKNTADYVKWFPSASVKYTFPNKQAIHASYSKRINRPSHFDLNPFRFYDDAFNYWQGNPQLKPEVTHATEIGFALSNRLMATLYYNQTHDVMTEVFRYFPTEQLTVTTQENLAKSTTYGLSLTASFSPYKWWTINALGNVFENRFKGDYDQVDVHSAQWTVNVSAQNAFQFKNNWQAEANAQFNGKSSMGLFEREAYFDLTLGLSKQLFQKKASIKLAATDVLNTRDYTITSSAKAIQMKRDYKLDSRAIILSLSYRFDRK